MKRLRMETETQAPILPQRLTNRESHHQFPQQLQRSRPACRQQGPVVGGPGKARAALCGAGEALRARLLEAPRLHQLLRASNPM